MLAHAVQQNSLPAGHFDRLLSKYESRQDNKITSTNNSSQQQQITPKELTLNGNIYQSINCTKIIYYHPHLWINKGPLVDGGTNGGICGNDVRIMHNTGRYVDVQGIDNH